MNKLRSPLTSKKIIKLKDNKKKTKNKRKPNTKPLSSYVDLIDQINFQKIRVNHEIWHDPNKIFCT